MKINKKAYRIKSDIKKYLAKDYKKTRGGEIPKEYSSHVQGRFNNAKSNVLNFILCLDYFGRKDKDIVIKHLLKAFENLNLAGYYMEQENYTGGNL